MQRKEFGELLATLRQDLSWTQFELGQFSKVDNAVISQIERGVKKYFDPELLFNLANALQLTTLERREFFLAASGLDEKQTVRQPSARTTTDAFEAGKMLSKMIRLMEQVRLPAFLVDVYSDVIAINQALLSFFKIPTALLESDRSIPGGFNTMRMLFGRELIGRTHVADNWDGYALSSMRAFREISLRYRATPYFKYLMKAFRDPSEYPLFDRFWKLVSSVEQDKEANMDYFSYRHVEFGDLKYYSSSTVTITSFGELFLVQYLPLDDHTGQVFEQLIDNSGREIIRLASWPEKAH